MIENEDGDMELFVQNALDVGSDEFYRANRYKLPLSVILINTQDKKGFDILEATLRKTDILQQIGLETIVVFLPHTNQKDAFLFIEKIKNKFAFTYTLAEYKEHEEEFIEKLFEENEKKCSHF
jgi:hypothetical protein